MNEQAIVLCNAYAVNEETSVLCNASTVFVVCLCILCSEYQCSLSGICEQ